MTLTALEGVPEVRPGDALDDVVLEALAGNRMDLVSHDVLVICQKIVSKAENRFVDLDTVTPGSPARDLASICDKDPRLVELVLTESKEVVRCVKGVLIVRHRLGFVVANAGIDRSNIERSGERVLLLPLDPDASATRLRDALSRRLGAQVGILVSDSFSRPWRMGVCGTCIGCAGVGPLSDQRGRADRFGRPLQVTQVAVADEIVAAATLVAGEADEGRPIVHVSGLESQFFTAAGPATQLVRPLEEDLFQ
jgi:coenzyme F420-0:L-glutamate ligase / coenzyme F420-1:gamma-L-glutamate ligase